MDLSWLTSEVVMNVLWLLIIVCLVGIADEIMKPAKKPKKKQEGHWEWVPDKKVFSSQARGVKIKSRRKT